MKKITTFILSIFIITITLLSCGCSGNKITAIDMPTYVKNTITATTYKNNTSSTRSLTLSALTKNYADTSYMDKYLDFTLSTNPSWTYKMYIEKVEFYVLTSESSNSQMSLALTMTNLADESNLASTATFSELKSHVPEQGTAQKYTFEINKVFSKATGSTITIDMSESSELLIDKNGQNSNFNWLIYGLKIYGEHREYSK